MGQKILISLELYKWFQFQCYFVGVFKENHQIYSFPFAEIPECTQKMGVELNFVCEECLDVISSVLLLICTLNLIIPENFSRSRNSNSSKIS